MTVKPGRLQRRVYEIGLIGRIAHNLAKYRVAVDGAYQPGEFLFHVQSYMIDRSVPKEIISEWLSLAESQAQTEIEFFMTHGRFADSSGGTSISIPALIGPILDQLGYE